MTDTPPPERETPFDSLLQFLYETHGSDFSGYKRTSLMRRAQKRLDLLGLTSYDEYIDYLQVRPDEYAALFDSILINVTGFFRDPASWDFLRADVIPEMLRAKEDAEPIRIWSAGCASGEEACSVAMLLAEELGGDAFRQRVKIYATDIDDEALARARQGVYTLKDLAAVPEDLRAKYFEIHGQRGVFQSDLHRAVIFGRHDLLQDAPISRIDLLICRNTLMYFTAETQARVLSRLDFALNDGGFLFVGRAEMLLMHANLFVPLDMKQRIFTKITSPNFRSRLRIVAQGNNDIIGYHAGRQVRLREAAFDSDANAVIVVDADGVLVMANERARQTLGVRLRDVGRRLQDVEVSYRPLELRTLIEQAARDRRALEITGVKRVLENGVTQFLDVIVAPLADPDGEQLGTAVTFNDVSASNRLQNELTRSRQELETAYEELQSTNEELETTNEELESTVEELESTNKDLQSANEELEHMTDGSSPGLATEGSAQPAS
ncbi:MAG: CheR family methyltransferase [Candidatus Dormibacteria bacterium]